MFLLKLNLIRYLHVFDTQYIELPLNNILMISI